MPEEVLHGDEQRVALLAGLHGSHDVGVLKSKANLALSREHVAVDPVPAELGEERLEGQERRRRRLGDGREVDTGHAALLQRLKDLISAHPARRAFLDCGRGGRGGRHPASTHAPPEGVKMASGGDVGEFWPLSPGWGYGRRRCERPPPSLR